MCVCVCPLSTVHAQTYDVVTIRIYIRGVAVCRGTKPTQRKHFFSFFGKNNWILSIFHETLDKHRSLWLSSPNRMGRRRKSCTNWYCFTLSTHTHHTIRIKQMRCDDLKSGFGFDSVYVDSCDCCVSLWMMWNLYVADVEFASFELTWQRRRRRRNRDTWFCHIFLCIEWWRTKWSTPIWWMQFTFLFECTFQHSFVTHTWTAPCSGLRYELCYGTIISTYPISSVCMERCGGWWLRYYTLHREWTNPCVYGVHSTHRLWRECVILHFLRKKSFQLSFNVIFFCVPLHPLSHTQHFVLRHHHFCSTQACLSAECTMSLVLVPMNVSFILLLDVDFEECFVCLCTGTALCDRLSLSSMIRQASQQW